MAEGGFDFETFDYDNYNDDQLDWIDNLDEGQIEQTVPDGPRKQRQLDKLLEAKNKRARRLLVDPIYEEYDTGENIPLLPRQDDLYSLVDEGTLDTFLSKFPTNQDTRLVKLDLEVKTINRKRVVCYKGKQVSKQDLSPLAASTLYNSKEGREFINRLGLSYNHVSKSLDPIDESETSFIEGTAQQQAELDQIQEDESTLRSRIEQNSRLSLDENESPNIRDRAREKLSRDTDKLEKLKREREIINDKIREITGQDSPIREKLKALFKKHGVTIASITIAAGITVGTIITSLTGVLKTVAGGLSNGLKAISSKLQNMLPGILGTIASFIFKTAGEAVKFVGEHIWLLVVGIVVYVIKKK